MKQLEFRALAIRPLKLETSDFQGCVLRWPTYIKDC